MKSLGLYYKTNSSIVCPHTNKDCPVKSKDTEKEIKKPDVQKVEIHCNLWKVQKIESSQKIFYDPEYDVFLDIGLKFAPCIKTLALYFPFSFTPERIIDLGDIIVQDQELCCLIFNEDVITTQSQDCFSIVKFRDKDKILWIYPIAKTNYECEDSQEQPIGTILHIDINSEIGSASDTNQEDSEYKNYTYIRFRINLTDEDLKSFKREELLSSDVIQSIFSKVEMYDFRINDKREINKKIDEQLKKDGYIPFRLSKVHFFLMCDTRNSIQQKSMKCKCRFLETEKWRRYLKQPIPQSLIAYHWTEKKQKELNIISSEKSEDKGFEVKWERKSLSNFRLFFMVTYPHRSWLQIIFYALLAIILGAFGSVLSTFICPSGTSVTIRIIAVVIGIILAVSILLTWYLIKRKCTVKFCNESSFGG